MAYTSFLNAGDGPSRRLAARLIPKFISKFPEHADTAAALLIDLHEYKQPCDHSLQQLVDQTKHDALQGLGSICEVAAKQGDKGTAAMQRLLDYLLR